MAMIDYGCIAKVNDKLIDKECFKIDNGYRPKYAVYRGYNEKYNIDGNYFAYLGDNDYVYVFINALC